MNLSFEETITLSTGTIFLGGMSRRVNNANDDPVESTIEGWQILMFVCDEKENVHNNAAAPVLKLQICDRISAHKVIKGYSWIF
jgi:hypothetical protein